MGRLEEVLAGPLPPSYQEASEITTRTGRFGTDVWLRILNYTADGADDGERAMGWHHLHSDVRFVCKSLYLASMHLLRSRYIRQYTARVRLPFTSDPFPTGEPSHSGQRSDKDGLPTYSRQASQPGASSTSAASTNFKTAHRETRVLDLFIAAAVYAGVQQNFGTFGSGMDSEGDGLADLFALHQPCARLEDLVLDVAQQRGLAAFSNHSRIAIDFRMRRAALRMSNLQGPMRTVCEVTRQSEETLEQTANALVERWRRAQAG